MTWLLDTNVVSELRKADPHLPVRAWAERQPPLATYLSVATVFELERGVRLKERADPAQGARLRRWLDHLVEVEFVDRVLSIDREVAVLAAGLHIPDPRPQHDAWIAATALHHGLTVVTRNVKDFAPLGAKVLDPWVVG
jgi:predicted nucleic acid-binding protein